MIRDTLKAQIEQIGKNIKKVLTKFLEIELFEDKELQIIQTNQELKKELDIDLDLLSNYPTAEITAYIKARKLTAKHLELLVEYTDSVAAIYQKKGETATAKIWVQKSIALLDVADIISASLSMERMQWKKELESRI